MTAADTDARAREIAATIPTLTDYDRKTLARIVAAESAGFLCKGPRSRSASKMARAGLVLRSEPGSTSGDWYVSLAFGRVVARVLASQEVDRG